MSSLSSLSVVPLSFFLAPDVGPLTLFLAPTLGLLMCFLALTLVAFRTLSISLHATLQCSNLHVSSLGEYLTLNSRLPERQARSTAPPQPTTTHILIHICVREHSC